MAKKSAKKSNQKSAKKSAAVKKAKAAPSKKPMKKLAKQAAKPAANKMAKPVAKKTATKIAAPKSTAISKALTELAAQPKASNAKLAAAFSPIDDRVVVEQDGFAERTAGGLFIPDTATVSEAHRQGKVVAVGSGRRDKKGRLLPLDVKLGDIVLYTRRAGAEIEIGGADFVILSEADILGVKN